MSSILDSLRKSDQQRKNKKTSGIDSFQLNNAANNHSPWPKRMMWLVLILALAATAAWSWNNGLFDEWFNKGSAEQTVTTQDTMASMTDNKPEDNVIPQAQPADKGSTQKPVAGRPDPEKVRNELKQNLLAERMQKAAESKSSLSVPEQLSTTEDEKNMMRQAESKTAQSEINDASKTSSETQLPSTQSLVTEDKKPFISRHNKNDDSRNYKYLYELPFSIRKNLPPVRLNIHIYDKNPEDRMAVINGLRFNVGDVVEELVRVEDITQEGVLLEFEGQLFMIPK